MPRICFIILLQRKGGKKKYGKILIMGTWVSLTLLSVLIYLNYSVRIQNYFIIFINKNSKNTNVAYNLILLFIEIAQVFL